MGMMEMYTEGAPMGRPLAALDIMADGWDGG